MEIKIAQVAKSVQRLIKPLSWQRHYDCASYRTLDCIMIVPRTDRSLGAEKLHARNIEAGLNRYGSALKLSNITRKGVAPMQYAVVRE